MNKSIITLLSFGLIFAAFLMIAAGCSLPGLTSDTSPSANNTTSEEAEKDLCDILPAAEVEAVIGFPVVIDKGNMPQTHFSSGCRYLNEETANNAAVLANFNDSEELAKSNYLDAVEFIKSSPDLAAASRVIPDVGTENTAWSTGKLTQINAYQGTVWISLTLMTDKQNDYETAAALARRALQKLQ